MPSLAPHLGTEAAVLLAVLERHSEVSKESKLAYCHLENQAPRRRLSPPKRSINGREASAEQLADLLVHAAEEIHVRRPSVKPLVLHQELPEGHVGLFPLLDYHELRETATGRLDTASGCGSILCASVSPEVQTVCCG